jgi:hypothetical protein
VEFTNPAKAKYKSEISGVSFADDNTNITTTYQPVINYRFGAEFRHNIFRARAGYGVQTNTYSDALGADADNKISSISGGLGVRTKRFSVDLAVIHSKAKSLYQPYVLEDSGVPDYRGPVARFNNRTINGVITLGFSL